MITGDSMIHHVQIGGDRETSVLFLLIEELVEMSCVVEATFGTVRGEFYENFAFLDHDV